MATTYDINATASSLFVSIVIMCVCTVRAAVCELTDGTGGDRWGHCGDTPERRGGQMHLVFQFSETTSAPSNHKCVS